MLHNLEKAPGSRSPKKRVGRGPASGNGKTCGKGHKGQNSRSGAKRRIGFEGGQMPLHRRLPKRGFTNIFKKQFEIVNLKDILGSKKLDLTQLIDAKALFHAGLIDREHALIKVLGDGELSQALNIQADKFSAAAAKKITEAGGTATVNEK